MSTLPPLRRLTQGPKFHWFGYYDKEQFDPTGRFVLGMEIGFEGRTPQPEDVLTVGVIDLEEKDSWTPLGTTRAWNWQQGCMLQWVPKTKSTVMWNDREEGRFVSHFLDIQTGKKRTLPAPLYTLSPDGKWGVAPDFRRLNDCRPGYGYNGLPDPNPHKQAPEDAGIWRTELKTGKTELIFSFADALKAWPQDEKAWADTKHWFNHLLFAPNSQRFIFLHRWRKPSQGAGFSTRVFTMGLEGQDLHLLYPYNRFSHFIWRDSTHITAWAHLPSHEFKFYLFTDKTDKAEPIGAEVMTSDGHLTYLPQEGGKRWIINDTYPDKEGFQHPYLFDMKSGKRTELGKLLAPPPYRAEFRCDLHLRHSRDGKKLCLDSAHENGRQLYLMEIGDFLAQ